jgi:DNA-binding transcriptional LysR family regulator
MISASPRRLSVFKSVVDAGGFNGAAERLGIAQPSVGAHIKALELQVGQPLFFRRRGSRPVLTKAGETLYSYAVDVLQRSEQARHVLRDLRARDETEVSLAIHRDVAPHMLATQMAGFVHRFPKLRMVTRTGTIEDVIELGRERVVDLAVVLAAGPVADLDSELLSEVPLWLVVSPEHPLARRKAIEADEVTDYPFFTGLRSSRWMELVGAALRQIGITRYDVAMELQDSASVKEMLRHGRGIAVLPACALDQELAGQSLVPLQLRTQPPPLEIRCAFRPPLSSAGRTLLSYLRDRA